MFEPRALAGTRVVPIGSEVPARQAFVQGIKFWRGSLRRADENSLTAAQSTRAARGRELAPRNARQYRTIMIYVVLVGLLKPSRRLPLHQKEWPTEILAERTQTPQRNQSSSNIIPLETQFCAARFALASRCRLGALPVLAGRASLGPSSRGSRSRRESFKQNQTRFRPGRALAPAERLGHWGQLREFPGAVRSEVRFGPPWHCRA
jgi:hypothetical protein